MIHAIFLKFHFHFPQNPGPCRIPGPGQISKVKSRPPGKFFELIPGGCPGGCTQLELTETLTAGLCLVPIFSKNLLGTGIMYHAFFPLRFPTFYHIFRVPGGVRHPSFVVIRQRVRAPGRSPCIIIRKKLREPGSSWIDHLTFTSGHWLVPHLQI